MREGFSETGKMSILSEQVTIIYQVSFIHQNSLSFQADQQYLSSYDIFIPRKDQFLSKTKPVVFLQNSSPAFM